MYYAAQPDQCHVPDANPGNLAACAADVARDIADGQGIDLDPIIYTACWGLGVVFTLIVVTTLVALFSKNSRRAAAAERVLALLLQPLLKLLEVLSRATPESSSERAGRPPRSSACHTRRPRRRGRGRRTPPRRPWTRPGPRGRSPGRHSRHGRSDRPDR